MFNGDWGVDRVSDFETGVDVLRIGYQPGEVETRDAFLAASSDVDGDLVYDAGDDGLNVVILEGVSLADFGALVVS